LARSPASLSEIVQAELKFTDGSKKAEESPLTFDLAMVVDTNFSHKKAQKAQRGSADLLSFLCLFVANDF
jgi:hypothetical protein